MPEKLHTGSSGTFYEYGNKDQILLAKPVKVFTIHLLMIEIDNVIDKNYSFIRESVHSFHLKRKECPRMKRNALNLLCMGLAFLIGVLLTPVDAYERDEMLSDNE